MFLQITFGGAIVAIIIVVLRWVINKKYIMVILQRAF